MFLSAVSAARGTGDGSVLWPKGCKSVEELPWDLARAIEHANKVLGWQENMMADDLPPDWMFPHDLELKDWFDAVTARRKEEYGGEESVPLEKNEYSDRF